MKHLSQFATGAAFAVALSAAFGAGYATRDHHYPDNWRWPAHTSPVAALTRTADSNLLAQNLVASKNSRAVTPDARPYETLDEVRKAIKENFVYPKTVDDTELTYGAIRGMLRSLGDRFTRFMTPEDYNEFLVSNKGEFTGIGARIDLRADYAGSPQAKPYGASRPYIVEPIDGGPAQKAGVKRNDVILSIDGHSTADMSEDATIAYIRGTRGTPVKLTLERKLNSPKDPKETKYDIFNLSLNRDTIAMHPVTFEWLPGDIAWLKLDEFNEKTDAEVGEALRKVKAGHNGQFAKGLIFDMRGNPGGLLNAAVDVGSRFINKGPIVITRERDGKENPLDHEPEKFMNLEVPVVVLVDKFSASAAEIVTGALKDDQKATVVGEKTFGKASVQVLVDLKNGGALVITTAKYLTPNKIDISDKGVAPDVQVLASAEDEKTGRGAQLQKAVEVLNGTTLTPPIAVAAATG